MNRRAIVIMVGAVAMVGAATLTGAEGQALAYSTPRAYADTALSGGGGGRYFTGSRHDRFTCEVCHDGGPAPGLRVLPQNGSFEPGRTYPFSMRTVDPNGGIGRPSVALVAEIAERGGTAVGTISLLEAEELAPDELCASGLPAASLHDADPDRIIVSMAKCGATQIRFLWTAPDQAFPDAKLYVAAVAADESEDPRGDGTLVQEFELRAGHEEFQAAVGACRLTHSGSEAARWEWLSILLLFARGRRRSQ